MSSTWEEVPRSESIMPIEKSPYVDYTLDEEKGSGRDRIVRVRMNAAQYEALKADMKLLQQPKESTALKEMLEIARVVLHSDATGKILMFRLNNIRRNKRTGSDYILQK